MSRVNRSSEAENLREELRKAKQAHLEAKEKLSMIVNASVSIITHHVFFHCRNQIIYLDNSSPFLISACFFH